MQWPSNKQRGINISATATTPTNNGNNNGNGSEDVLYVVLHDKEFIAYFVLSVAVVICLCCILCIITFKFLLRARNDEKNENKNEYMYDQEYSSKVNQEDSSMYYLIVHNMN